MDLWIFRQITRDLKDYRFRRIMKNYEKLLLEYLEGSIDREQYFAKKIRLDKRLLDISEICDTVEKLEERMLIYYFNYDDLLNYEDMVRHIVKIFVLHEKEHAEVATRFGLSYKFLYIPGVAACLYTYNLEEKSRDCDMSRFIECMRDLTNISNPSLYDKKIFNIVERKLNASDI